MNSRDIIQQQDIERAVELMADCREIEAEMTAILHPHPMGAIQDLTPGEVQQHIANFPHKQYEGLKNNFQTACERLYRHLASSKVLE